MERLKMLKEFIAKCRVATVGSLLSLLCLISTGCSTQNQYYGQFTTADRTHSGNSIYHLLGNGIKNSAYSVPRKDRDRHQQCVYFVLDNLDAGEGCTWYSPDNSAKGVVAIRMIYPQDSKMCHVLYNTVHYNGKHNSWQDTACYNAVRDKWTFISKS